MKGFLIGVVVTLMLYIALNLSETTITTLENNGLYTNSSNLELLPRDPVNFGNPSDPKYLDINELNLEQHRYFDNGVEIVDRCGAYDLSSVDGQSQCQTHLLFIDTYKDAPVIPTEERIILDYK